MNVSQGVLNYAIPFPTDTFAGLNSADCGERAFSFTLNTASSVGSIGSTASSFITLLGSGLTYSMAINSLSSLEAQDVKVEVSLVDYPAIPAVSATFLLNFICGTTVIAVDHSVVPDNSTFSVEIGAAAGPCTMPTFDINACAFYANEFEFALVGSNTILPELSYVATVTESNGIK